MANKLADMHQLAPQLTEAVAKRITTSDLHDKAIRDLGAFVHRTVVEDEHTYAVRIDDGALLDAAEQVDHARRHLGDAQRGEVAAILGCEARSTASSTRSRPARGSVPRSSGSHLPSATAHATAATRSHTTAARTSPPASGSSTQRS